jgi:hypothetical protein
VDERGGPRRNGPLRALKLEESRRVGCQEPRECHGAGKREYTLVRFLHLFRLSRFAARLTSHVSELAARFHEAGFEFTLLLLLTNIVDITRAGNCRKRVRYAVPDGMLTPSLYRAGIGRLACLGERKVTGIEVLSSL